MTAFSNPIKNRVDCDSKKIRLQDDNPLRQRTRLGSLACSTADHQEKLDLL